MIRPDPYHDGDPTDAPLYLAQFSSLVMTEGANGLDWSEEEDSLVDDEGNPLDDDALVEGDYAVRVWVTDGIHFTREAADAKCRGRSDWRSYGIASKGALKAIVREHTEGQQSEKPEGMVKAAEEMLALMDNLWKAVPWGETSNVDFQALNEVPGRLREAVKAAKARGEQ